MQKTWTARIASAFGFEPVEKLNPAQPAIARQEGSNIAPAPVNFWGFYEQLGIVNRGVNMLVDAASQIDNIMDGTKIAQSLTNTPGSKMATVKRILNTEPNPFQDISTFRRLLYMDIIIEGNCFVYYDGVHIYHMPAHLMEIITDENTFVKGYKLIGAESRVMMFKPEEIIHIKDNSVRGIYRGKSRLASAKANMTLLWRMVAFQDKFFENGAVPGLVLKSPNALSEKLKERMIESWLRAYSPNNGGRRPLILDGGMELDRLTDSSLKELDFSASITSQEESVLKALGIPPILLDGGNNANIRPNQRLFYIETVIPLVDKLIRGFERFFGYKLIPDNDIPGLQPELQDQATYCVSLVNGGIITPNEARQTLAFEPSSEPDMDKIRIPVNVAGSAADPSQGGAPTKPVKA